jgi:hypothetical protein
MDISKVALHVTVKIIHDAEHEDTFGKVSLCSFLTMV